MKVIRKIKNLITDPSVDRTLRIFIFFSVVAFLIALVATLGDIIYGENIVEIITLSGELVAIPAAAYVAVKTGKTESVIRGVSFVMIMILMPVIFLFGGGMTGGAAPWFVFSYVFVGMVLSGWWRIAYLIILTIIVAALITFGYLHPELIGLHSRSVFYIDVTLGIIEVGFTCCLFTWFQNYMFLQENRKAMEEAHKVEELNRLQNRFFSSMSHEIRTPINSILGLNEIILRQEDASEEIKKDAGNIDGAGRMLLSLINDILDFSKIEAGKMDIVPVNYNIAAMISDLVNMLWLRVQQKGLELKVEVDPTIPAELFGDEVRIKQILVNLLNNAVKYTDEGSVTLYVEKEEIKEDQVLLMFSVIDTGMGIKQDAIPYLFDSFRRLDEEKNAAIEGTGLGLSIVKQLLDLMDGKITVNSVYDQGSTFTVTLWQRITRFDTVGDINITESETGQNRQKYSPGFTAPDVKILIVDDSRMNLEVEKKLLSGNEIYADTVSNGREALKMTMISRYDMILMDHLMPEMDGIECMQLIRKQEGGLNNHVPIIVLTANAGSENRELYSSSGFDGYLVKPVNGRQLEEMILLHLPGSKVIKNIDSDLNKMQMNTAGTYSRKVPVIITTGSACDLPAKVTEKQQIDTIPFRLKGRDGVFYDSYETGTDELIRYVKSGNEYICESPTVSEFEKFFGDALKKAHTVIHISVSSSLSDEYENARQAAKAYGDVRVFDSQLASGAVGLLVLAAHRMSTRSDAPEKIIEELSDLKDMIRCSFVTDNRWLLSRMAFLGENLLNTLNMLTVRPYVGIRNGKYRVEHLKFGEREDHIERYIDHALPRSVKPDRDVLMLVYTDMSGKELYRATEYIKKRSDLENILTQRVSGAAALDWGPDAFGLIYFKEGEASYKLGQMLLTDEESAESEAYGYEEIKDDFPASENEQVFEDEIPENSEDDNKWYEKIQGIDANAAIENSGSEELLRTVLGIFYESIDIAGKEIDDFYNEEDWVNYTIKIHALKSSAKLVGAGLLSKEAQALENAGKEGNIDFIKANHGKAMEDYRSYKERLKPYFENDGDKDKYVDDADIYEFEPDPGVNENFDRYLIESIYEALKEGALDKDDQMIEETFNDIRDYSLPPEDFAAIELLKDCFSRREYAAMTDIIDGIGSNK